MSLLESLRVAWEALGANKLRSVLTMLGIIIGVGSVVAIVAIGRGTEAAVVGELQGLGSGQIQVMAGRYGPGAEGYRVVPMSDADLRTIEQLLPDVEGVLTTTGMGAQARFERQVTNASVTGTFANADVFDIKVAEGRWFSKQEEEGGARVVVMGSGAVKRLMGEGVDPVGLSITLNGQPFLVIGVTQPQTGLLASLGGGEDNSYYVPITYVRRMTNQHHSQMAFIKVRPGANPNTVMADAIALLERNNPGAGYTGQSFDQILGVISGVMTIITGVLSAVAAISLVVGGVGIMNIMLVSVTERTREIGIRKAIGAAYGDIMLQFLIEAVLLSLMGGMIGVALASLPVWLVGRALDIPLLVDWKSILLAVGFSCGVGVLFGVYPASKAARLDPIEALRYE